jgi:PPK2 family polyphosphate:nucleotide phosphotransferase
MINTKDYLIAPGHCVRLHDIATKDNGGLSKKQGKQAIRSLSKRLFKLQDLLYAKRAKSLLIVFQAMDAGGKDSTTRRVFTGVNPNMLQVRSFKKPNTEELSHDFLWRIHGHTPPKGVIGVFNRSHYEDIVTVGVNHLQPSKLWQPRFEHINSFEKMLVSEGTMVLKFYLHISKNYQKERLQRRLDRADKHWKFEFADIDAREHWDEYLALYSEAIERCSTTTSPWYVVPSERRWYRDLVVLQSVVNTLDALQMDYPEPEFDPNSVKIP